MSEAARRTLDALGSVSPPNPDWDPNWIAEERLKREEDARRYADEQRETLTFQARAEALRLALAHSAQEGGGADDIVGVARAFAAFLLGEVETPKAN